MIEIGKEMVCVRTDNFNILTVDKIEKCTGIYKVCNCCHGVTIGKSYPETPKLGALATCTYCGQDVVYPTDEHLFPIKCFTSMDDFLAEEIAELTEEQELVLADSCNMR